MALPAACLLAAAENPKPVSADGVNWLAPSAFPGLPPSIVADLESRGCTVPQTYISPEPNNVIRGQFYRPGQHDWAVLCSKSGSSTILVYPTGSPSDVEALADPVPDAHRILDIGNGRIGFNRSIGTIGGPQIIWGYETYREGPKPPPIDHNGINDAIAEKTSTVLYWYAGEWLRLAGAD
jgi:hypothetical protein